MFDFNWKRPAILISVTLCTLSSGTAYAMGNLIPYYASYIKLNVDFGIDSTHFSWMSGLTKAGFSLVSPLLPIFIKLLGFRGAALFGEALFCAFLAVTTIAVQKSFIAFVATYGFLAWIAYGIKHFSVMTLLVKWFPDHLGIVTGIMFSGGTIGGIILSFVSTLLINPANKSVDLEIGGFWYFSDESLLSEVPKYFWRISVINAVIFVVCFPFFFNPPKKTDGEITKNMESCHINQMTLKEMLSNKVFYMLWLSSLLTNLAETFGSSYSKTYGNEFIKDDYHLSNIISISIAFSCLGKISFGVLFEKFPFKYVSAFHFLGFVIFIQCMLAAQYMSTGVEYFYGFLCCGLQFFSGGSIIFVPLAASSYFGPKNFSSIFGILLTAQTFGGILSGYFHQQITQNLLWTWSFTAETVPSLLGLVISLCLPLTLGKLHSAENFT